MKVLLCAQFYPPINGGEERHVRNLAHTLYQRGHDVDILTIATTRGRSGEEFDRGVRVVRAFSTAQRITAFRDDPSRPHAAPVIDGGVRRVAAEIMDQKQYDVVHAHNWIVASVIGPAAARDIPVVVTLHDYSHVCAVKRYMRGGSECTGPSVGGCAICATRHYGAPGAVIALGNRWSRRVREHSIAQFIAVSHAVASRNGLAAGPVPYEVIPNFIPVDILDDAVGLTKAEEPAAPIVFVGDLTADKGADVLLAAYERMQIRRPLVIAGRRGDAELRLPSGAEMLDELAHPAVLDLMRSSCCVVVPSVWPEPCPTVVLEAMAVGRPVVASAAGGIVDLVEDGQTGYLVPPGNPVALGAMLDELLAFPAHAHRLGLSGRARVERFTDAAVVPVIERAYRRVCQPLVPDADQAADTESDRYASVIRTTKSHHHGGRPTPL